MEIELKYQIPEKFILQDLEMEDAKKISMQAYYFDTADSLLYKNKLSFRVRFENDDLVCTVKYQGKVINGLHTREEINIPCDKEFLNNPTLDILKGYDCYELYNSVIKDSPLILLLEMKYIRHEKEVEFNDSIFNLTFDDGVISSIKGEVKIHEMEVEIENGNESDLLLFGEKLKGKYNLSIQNKSKLERVYELLYKN